jgi:hypothetical protein
MVTSSTNQGLTQVYGAQGSPIPGVFQPPIVTTRDPTSSDINFKVGRQWVNKSTPSMWFLGSKTSGSATWIAAGSGTLGGVTTLTGGSGGALSPTAGNINILGTASQLTSTGSGSTITFSLPAAVTFPGSATTTSTLTAGTDITATAGNVIIAGAGKQLRVEGGAVTDFIGTATLTSGTSGAIANTNIAAGDRIFVQRTTANASSAFGSYDYTISAGASFTITAKKADTTTETGDASTVTYFIVRQI